MYEVAFKSNMGSYYDCDGCDEIIAKVNSTIIPQVNSVIELKVKSEYVTWETFLVREVKHTIDTEREKEYIRVYVIEY